MSLRPAEWAKQARTILSLPDKNVYHQYSHLVTRDIFSIAEAVSRFQPVTLLAGTERATEARERFKNAARIDVHAIAGGDLDLWMRDVGPTFVRKGSQVHGINFNFNGWGDKFLPKTSIGLSSKILGLLNIQEIKSSLVAEGGALEVDGDGTLLATESSIINDNRNPGKSKEDIEAELSKLLGLSKFIWIPGRKDVDVTDCHVDALARFVRPGHVLLARPTQGSPWEEVYNETKEILAKQTDAKGRTLHVTEVQDADVTKLKLPKDEVDRILAEGEGYVPALNYANFLLVNGGVLVPQFGDAETDVQAVKVFGELFPEREVVLVRVVVLGLLGGVIHCSSQEVPL